MKLIFCSDPMDPKHPDAAYEREAAAAHGLGISYSLINFEALVYEKDPTKAVRKVATSEQKEQAVYRGWMLTPEQYASMYDALAARRIILINTPKEYRHCHYLPESYAKIEGHTPRSVWISAEDDLSTPHLLELLAPFGSGPVIVKDFVKSRKHEWNEACFIPSASDAAAVQRVVRKLLELQGDDLNAGLVFREFVEFEQLTTHSKSGMPLSKEFRIFFLDGEPVHVTEYWEEGDYQDLMPPLDTFRKVAADVGSRFFTMDVAKKRDGNWMIMELGDAQVSELNEHADPTEFFESLRSLIGRRRVRST